MALYIFKRVLGAIPLLFGLLTITFFVIQLAPGDPTALYLQGDADPAIAERLRTNLGLDQPLHIRYVKWLGSAVTGELGVSFSKHKSVTAVLADTIPQTLLLTSFALLFNIALGVLLGVITAVKRGTKIDTITNVFSLILYSVPEFWLALMLILTFSEQIPIFPASGIHSPFADRLPTLHYLWDVIQHMVLPVFVLGIASAAATGRFLRGSLLEVINQDYIRTARAKGMPESRIIWKHALRNALIPIITIIGMSLPFLLGGAVIVETIFGWPGMGRLTIDAIFSRDYPLIIGCTLVSGVLVILGNLFADVMYAVADPRIRFTGTKE
ncbi:MAG: diguanylate cyclase [Ectothiorhodospiraceae bacterium]|nr:diguanylate cyclase [Ectothiorhodospiraceae bacterium]